METTKAKRPQQQNNNNKATTQQLNNTTAQMPCQLIFPEDLTIKGNFYVCLYLGYMDMRT